MANDPYGLELSGISPEISGDLRSLKRRDAIANALLEQSQQPLQTNRMAGGYVVPINPLEGLGKLAQAYSANKIGKENDAKFSDIGTKYQGALSDAIANHVNAISGTPAQPAQETSEDSFGTPAQAAVPASPDAIRKANIASLTSAFPQVQQLGKLGFEQQFKGEESAAAREQRSSDLQAQRDQREHELKLKMEDSRLSRQDRADLMLQLQDMKNEGTRQTRAMVGALRNPPAPSMTDIIDPTNPNQMIKIDARVYKGGSIGSPGVIGVGGKEPTAAKKAEQVDSGRNTVSSLVSQLHDYYDQLDKNGGIVNPDKGTMANISASGQSSSLGQYIGNKVGTQNQSVRTSIEQQRPALLNAIKQATGMSAKQMDSNAELKLWLQSVTDPSQDVKANRSTLNKLDELYGLGGKTASPNATAAPSSSPRVVDW